MLGLVTLVVSLLEARAGGGFDTCNFDDGNCGFTNQGPYSWRRRSGATPSHYAASGETGPASDHTSWSGSYVYIEASDPNFPSKGPFVLETSFDDPPGVEAVRFFYSMYGFSIGSLRVDTFSNTSSPVWTTVWTKSGDQGPSWQGAVVDIHDPSV